MLHVRTKDLTPPTLIFVEAESDSETSIVVTLQLNEPSTAYCGAYTSAQVVNSALFTALTTGANVYQNVVTNWNNIYINFEVRILSLQGHTVYYVYCAAQDDEIIEGATTITPAPTSNNVNLGFLTESTGRSTLDLTPPIQTIVSVSSLSENTATVYMSLSEPGTAWCTAVLNGFAAPTINEIIAAGFYTFTSAGSQAFNVVIQNLVRDTEYDTYCHARDTGTTVPTGVPSPGNPGNDDSYVQDLLTMRNIHTMGDSTPPSLVSVLPVYQQTGAAQNPVFKIVFNEDIQAGTGYLTFAAAGGSNTFQLNINQANNGLCANSAAKISVLLTTLTADFTSCTSFFLTANTQWYASMPAGVIQDTAGNSAATFGASNSYYFTTGNSGAR